MSMLWRVEKEGLKPSYLYGTVHHAANKAGNLRPEVEHALSSCDRVVLEYDCRPENIHAEFSKIFLEGISIDGDLKALLGDVAYARVAKSMEKKGFPEYITRITRPWLCVMILAENLRVGAVWNVILQQMAVMSVLAITEGAIKGVLDEMDTIDILLHRKATQQGKTLVFLDKVGTATDLFKCIPQNEAVSLLYTLDVNEIEPQSNTKGKTLKAYEENNLDAMKVICGVVATGMANTAAAGTELCNNILDGRTLSWMPEINRLLLEGGAFIGVGAFHLIGYNSDNGLLTILQKSGFEVTPI